MLTFSVNPNIQTIVRPGTFVEARPTTDNGRRWLSNIWLGAIKGKVEDDVNVDAYGYTCELNTRMAISAREVPLLTTEEVEEGVHGVSEVVAVYVSTEIDNMIDRSEIPSLVNQFLQAQEMLEVEERVNLLGVIRLALRADGTMIEKLRQLMKKYRLEEVVEGVLRNSECLAEVERSLQC